MYKSIHFLIISALFIAITVIFTHFLAIQTMFLRISFACIPLAIYATIFGPWYAGLIAVIADIMGSFFFPAGPFFPGFTLSAFLSAFIYGFFFHHKPITVKNTCLAFALVCIFVNIGLNTLWLAILYNKAVHIFFFSRFIKEILTLPIHIFIFYKVYKALFPYIKKTNFMSPKS